MIGLPSGLAIWCVLLSPAFAPVDAASVDAAPVDAAPAETARPDSASEPAPTAEAISRLTRQLGSSDYATREAATEALSSRPGDALAALEDVATDSNRERGSRAIQILERWAFVDETSDEAAARTAREAEAALMRLAAQKTHLSPGNPDAQSRMLAELALIRHSATRQDRAVEAIRRLGGVVSDQGGFLGNRTRQQILAGQSRRDGFQISLIKIGPSWTGGRRGLDELLRLAHVPRFKLRIEGQPDGVERSDVTQLMALLVDTELDFTSTAALGITSDNSTPLVVTETVPGGACARAGIRKGDIVRTLDGKEVNSLNHVRGMLLAYKPGDTIPLTIDRNGRQLTIDVYLDDWSKNDAPIQR